VNRAFDLPLDASPWLPAEDPAAEGDRLLLELTRATGGDPAAVELANPPRDEKAVLDGLLAMISDLGGGEVIPPPEVEADRLLAALARLGE
jgi:hypothetical protein